MLIVLCVFTVCVCHRLVNIDCFCICVHACAGRKRSGWIGWTTRSGWETWAAWSSWITGQITSIIASASDSKDLLSIWVLNGFGFVGWPRKTRGSWKRCEYSSLSICQIICLLHHDVATVCSNRSIRYLVCLTFNCSLGLGGTKRASGASGTTRAPRR